MKPALLTALLAGAVFGQNVDNSAGFDSADVHVSSPVANPTVRGGFLRGRRYELRTATMADMIGFAFDLDPERVQGGPSWLDWDRFDVLAKAPLSTKPQTLGVMLRNLLADRFKLAAHKDTKLMPAFVLTAGKGKSKMKAAGGGGQPGCENVQQKAEPGVVPLQGMSCHDMTMATFVDFLFGYGGGTYLTDPVVDQTGLEGAWDFELKWTPRNRLAQAGADGVSLFDAVDKQLGLKLEAKKAPLPVVVVDNVNEAPTPNEPGVAAKIPPPPPTEFEVATIKLTAPGAPPGQNGRIQNGRLDLQNSTLKQLIQVAWDFGNNDEMIAGLPKSADSIHYDVAAKVATMGATRAEDIDVDALRLMLRALLEERFGLKTHMEDRPVSAYTMIATKQLKLQKADPQNRTNCKAGAGTNPMLNRLITCTNMTTTQFAGILQTLAGGYVRAPIKDATGIEGRWDFSVNFSGVGLLPGARFDPNASTGLSDPNGSLSLPEAMQKQLGLKLEMGKRPLPVLVVDRVEEKPAEN
ncbi:MAG TPA: TIGR03435 family protein [Bryobacteraceae bacterium]|nr:TIGR03435 family protein [Bryobacteraceae bacterium]